MKSNGLVKAGIYIVGIAGLALGVVALMIPSILLEGFVAAKLWNWFVEGQFHTFHMHYAEAIGIVTLANFATRQYVQTPQSDSTGKGIAAFASFAFVGPLMTLLIGYIAHQYV